MSSGTRSIATRLPAPLKQIIWGTEDDRVRATWRVLLATPLFFLVTAGVFIVRVVELSQSMVINIAVGTSIPAVVIGLLALFVWARRLDRRSLADYGIHFRPSAVIELIAGFGVVVVGYAAWVGLGVVGGWFTVEQTMRYTDGSLPIATGVIFVALLFSAFPQALWYCGLIFDNAKEGINSRTDNQTLGLVLAGAIASTLFVAFHFPGSYFSLAVGVFLRLTLVAYALIIYVQTKSLFLVVGGHAALAMSQGVILARPPVIMSDTPVLFTVIHTGSLPMLIEFVPFVPLAIAYVLLRGFLMIQEY